MITYEKLTCSQKNAIDLINKGDNILIVGKPGTGKSVLPNIIKDDIFNEKVVQICASTGKAANNYETGQTLHSFLHWKKGMKVDEADFEICAKELQHTDVLIIDEVSMLDESIVNLLYRCYMHVDKIPQIVFIGDFFQLPPVGKNLYPFEYKCWNDFNFKPCILGEVVRQKDPEFIRLLEMAMYGDRRCIQEFNKRTSKTRLDGAITLCTHNDDVAAINSVEFSKLKGKAYLYQAEGDVLKANFRKAKVENVLSLKIGMKVMAIRNDRDDMYHNGALGTVTFLNDEKIIVKFDNSDNEVEMHKEVFQLECNENSYEKVKIMQYPLTAGYAITVHKSQGQTFDKVNICIRNCWEPGQLYVALSRAKTLEGIYFEKPLNSFDLKTDYRVVDFYADLEHKMKNVA